NGTVSLMKESTKYTIRVERGTSLTESPLAGDIIALDRRNMEAILKAVGYDFPEERRRTTLFHPSNHIIIAEISHQLAGYVDYCDDFIDPHAIYLSSIQIDVAHRGGPVFKLLVSNLLLHLKPRTFETIRTNIQKSNLRMIGIAQSLGFTIEENPSSLGT